MSGVSSIPCELCKYAKPMNSGGFILTYCEKKKEIICDRQWINPLNCWKYCECAMCPFFEPLNKEEYIRIKKELARVIP